MKDQEYPTIPTNNAPHFPNNEPIISYIDTNTAPSINTNTLTSAVTVLKALESSPLDQTANIAPPDAPFPSLIAVDGTAATGVSFENLEIEAAQANTLSDVADILIRAHEIAASGAELKLLEVRLCEATGLDKTVVSAAARDASKTIRPFGLINSYDAAAKAYSSVLDSYASPEGDLPGVVFTEGSWHVYDQDEGHYEPITDEELTKDIRENLGRSWTVKTDRDVREVKRRLIDRYEAPQFFYNAVEGLPARDCFVRYDPHQKALVSAPHARSNKARFCLDVGFSRTATPQRFLTALRRILPDDTKLESLQEALGCMLIQVTPMKDAARRMLIMWGPGGSGKSTLIDVARSLLPSELVTSVPPNTWKDEFSRARLAGARLNYCTELAGNQLIATDILKQVLARETVTGRHRYGQEHELRPVAFHVVATNELPHIRDNSGALDRRLMVIHFDRVLDQTEMDANFLESVHQERAGIIAWAAEGAERLMSRGHFQLPNGHAEAMLAMKFGDDVISLFAHTQVERAPGHRVTSAELRAALAKYAFEQGHDRSLSAGSGAMRRLSSLMELNYGARRSPSNNAPFYTGVALKRPTAPDDAQADLGSL